MLIRDKYLLNVKSVCKVKGLPFSTDEIKEAVFKELKS